MNLYRKLLILFIVLITIYLIYRLIINRYKIYQLINKVDVENFDLNNYDAPNVNSLATNNSVKLDIRPFPFSNMKKMGLKTDSSKELKQYCIKSAYNCIYDGEKCSTNMLLYVLSRGCRFLDLEVFYDESKTKAVLFAYSNTYTMSTEGIDLPTVLDLINEYGFGSGCPNKTDPLFVQFRVKYSPSSDSNHNEDTVDINLKTIYNTLASAIKSSLTNRYSYGVVTSETPIDSLANQIVVIMDLKNNRNFANLSPELNKVVNMIAGSENMAKSTYTDTQSMNKYTLSILKDGITTDTDIIQEIVPTQTDNDTEMYMTDNFNALTLLIDYSANITPMQFWHNGPELVKYETIFNKAGTGILPIADAISYAERHNAEPSIIYPMI